MLALWIFIGWYIIGLIGGCILAYVDYAHYYKDIKFSTVFKILGIGSMGMIIFTVGLIELNTALPGKNLFSKLNFTIIENKTWKKE